jgi:hypothetical protein
VDANSNYYLIAIIQSQQGITAVTTAEGNTLVNFSLLSPQAPCVVVDAGDGNVPPNCLQPQKLSFTSGSSPHSLTLKGLNWLLQAPISPTNINPTNVGTNVTITVTCDSNSATSCNQAQSIQATTKSDSKGQFTKTLSLPTNLVGTYDICVASQAPTNSQPMTNVSNTDTVVNNALTFDCPQQGDKAGLTITINKPVPPPVTPTVTITVTHTLKSTTTPNELLVKASQALDTLSFIAWLPIFAAIVLYLIYGIRTKRFSDGKVTEDSTGNATPPVSASYGQPTSPAPAPTSSREYIAQLAERGDFDGIQTIAREKIVADSDLWDMIRKSLQKVPRSLIPDDAGYRAFANLEEVDNQTPEKTLSLCCESIVLYEMLLPTIARNSLAFADTSFNLGAAYRKLSTLKLLTISFLLSLAIENYKNALQIYENLNERERQV